MATAGETPANEAAATDAVRGLLADGQPFRAFDQARQALERFPDNLKLRQYAALALLRTGALEEARRQLDLMPGGLVLDEAPFRQLRDALTAALALVGPPSAASTDRRTERTALGAMARLAAALERVRGRQLLSFGADREALILMARLYREFWRLGGDIADLERSFDLYLEGAEEDGGIELHLPAAVSAYLLGHRQQAKEIARTIFARSGLSAGDPFLTEAAKGIAHLLLGKRQAAVVALREARTLAGTRYQDVLGARNELQALARAGLAVPAEALAELKPPAVVVFAGPPIDRPGQAAPLFPAHLEHALRSEIDRRLESIDAQIGYSSAACGSDILFIEAMLERGAEVNIVLPFAVEDFLAENVAYAGPRWVRRFRNALKLAHSVSFATEERFLGHENLYRFGNQVKHGLARLRAGFLDTAPHLLAVWDLMSGSLPGGAADVIDLWGDTARLSIVDIDELLQANPSPTVAPQPPLPVAAAASPPAPAVSGRVIRAMLFADLVGYSAMREEHVGAFLAFMTALEARLKAVPRQPDFVHTWGDALFAVAGTARAIGEYALAVKDAVRHIGRSTAGLPKPLDIRISLHAGPVFAARDPFTGLDNAYGTHINRAARLEPVTVPGHVYATQPFVALLAAESAEARHEAERDGLVYADPFATEYVGVIQLAKKYGQEAVYHLRRRQD